MALYGAETWTHREVDQNTWKVEMWCWRKIEKISWIDHVRNEDVLQRQGGEECPAYSKKRRKANWICYIFRMKCLLKRIIEGKIGGGIEVTGIRRRSRKQLLDDLKETRGYWKLKRKH
jgi:hypothetical protein